MNDLKIHGVRIYRMAPDLRRSAIYAMIGLPGTLLVAWAFVLWFQVPLEIGRHLPAVIAFCFFSLVMIAPLRWRLRVDATGISRRWLYKWDHWSWDDFASGRLYKRGHGSLVDPRRPWWRRKLTLHTDEAELDEIVGLINRHYQLPPPPEVPDELRAHQIFVQRIRFHEHGIEVIRKRDIASYLWSEVRRIHITRTDPLCHDFVRLEIVLPDRMVELRSHNGSPNWQGPKPIEINEFLRRYGPEETIEVDLRGKPPARRSDVERQLEELGKEIREHRMAQLFFLILCAGWTAMLLSKALPRANMMWDWILLAIGLIMIPVFFVPILLYQRAYFDRRLRKLESWLPLYDEDDAEVVRP